MFYTYLMLDPAVFIGKSAGNTVMSIVGSQYTLNELHDHKKDFNY